MPSERDLCAHESPTAKVASKSSEERTTGVKTVPVAVVITTFNGRSRGFLEKAIVSVLEQTVTPEEFVVIDDGSKDGTVEWIQSRFPSVRVVTKINGGPASARNRGVQETRCPLICFLDDDDVWLPRKLEVQHGKMSGPHPPDLVFSAITIINERDEVTGAWHPEDFDFQWPNVLLRNPIWNPSCVMMRREAFTGTGGFNEAVDHKFVEDYEMWIKMARAYRIESIAEPLILYRSHSTQNSSSFSGILGKVIPIVRSYAAKVPGLDPRRVVAYHLYGGFLYTLHKAGWKPARDLLRANPNGNWLPVLMLLRLVGVLLHRFRSIQRRWRRFESRIFLGDPSLHGA